MEVIVLTEHYLFTLVIVALLGLLVGVIVGVRISRPTSGRF